MSKKKFERETDNRIIGGVCGGLARYFGVSSKLTRFLFFLSFFFGTLGLWVYILLWLITPLRHSSRERLSRDLRRKARNLDTLAEEASQKLGNPKLVEKLQNMQELIETLLPDFESRSLDKSPELRPVYEAALVHLPELLENFLRLPAGYAQAQAIQGGMTALDQLAGELLKLEDTLNKVLRERYGQKFTQTAGKLDSLQTRYEDDPLAAFRQPLDALQARAAGHLDHEALAKIETIKGSLLTVLGRLQGTAAETDQNLYNVRQIALEYLPNTVDKFLALPPAMAELKTSSQGKTPQAALHEQLDVLDNALGKLVSSLYQEDAQGLLVHGHFLRDKFLDPQKEWMGQ